MRTVDQIISTNPSLSPREYFEDVWRKFLEAGGRNPVPIEKKYQMGPFAVRFQFANERLLPLIIPAFSHLKANPLVETDLDIAFWDSASTGITLQAPPWTGYIGGQINFHEEPYLIRFDYTTGLLYLFNRETRQGIFWVRDYREVPYFETSSPLRALLDWWLRDTSFQLMHGGAIASEHAGILIMGPGGAGKSTTCSLTFRSSLFFLADDFCLVDTKNPSQVYCLYSSTKLNPDVFSQFPELRPATHHLPQGPEEKATFLLHPHFKEKIQRQAPLRALLIPKISGKKETRIFSTSPFKALAALAPSTLFILSGYGDHSFKKASQLVKNLPCFELELGYDFSEIPLVINEFLTGL